MKWTIFTKRKIGYILATLGFIDLLITVSHLYLKFIKTSSWLVPIEFKINTAIYIIMIFVGLNISKKLHSIRFYIFRFLSRTVFIFVGFFFTYLFITKSLMESFEIKTINLFDWNRWFIFHSLLSLFSLMVYAIFLEDLVKE